MARESIDIPAIVEIGVHFSWESRKTTKFFIAVIKEGLAKAQPDQFTPYFELMTALLAMKDSLQSWRIDAILYAHLQVIEDNTFRKESTDEYVKFVVDLAKKNENVKVWLFKHKDSLNEVLGDIGYKIL